MRYRGLLLAAGRGTRLAEKSDGAPKALVKVGSETLVDHNLRRLIEAGVERVVVVVGFMAERVKEHLARSPWAGRIDFVEQTETLGTGHAVAISRAALGGGPFLLCYCDNYTPYRLEPLVRSHESGGRVVTLACFKAEDPTRHGILQVEGGRVVNIVERPKTFIGDLAFAGMGAFEPEIFDAVDAVKRSAGGEYFLTDAIMDLVRAGVRPVGVDVLDCFRVNINSPIELEKAWVFALAHGGPGGKA